MLTLVTFIFVLMIWVTLKVGYLVWKQDRVLPLMLASLSASSLMWILYFVFVLVSEYYLPWQNIGDKSYTCGAVYMTQSPAFFLVIGILLNVNKWINFCIRIRSTVLVGKNLTLLEESEISQNSRGSLSSSTTQTTNCRAQQQKSLFERNGLSLKRYINILNIATASLITIYALFFFSATAVACQQNSFT